jgi:ribosome-binding protein aMBF1 (putative translation factor)
LAKKKRVPEQPAAPVQAEPQAEAPASPPPAPPEPVAPVKLQHEDNGSVYTGELIRKMREQKGLTLKEIAERTKISVGVLQALEDERYEDMPSARVYVRGFVRCFAEELGLDKDQVSQSYVPRWERWFTDHGRRY